MSETKDCVLVNVSNRFYDYDKRGVRAFVRYQSANGGWTIECYRKKTKQESEGEQDWKMIRHGHIQSYNTREEAEEVVLTIAEEICTKYGY